MERVRARVLTRGEGQEEQEEEEEEDKGRREARGEGRDVRFTIFPIFSLTISRNLSF